MRRRLLAILTVSAAALALAGCTFSAEAGPTASASNVATAAENALEKQIGTRPSIDCGSKDVVIVKGKSITCDLTDPSTGDVYDVKITFTSVKGQDYTIHADVADAPKKTGSGGGDATGNDGSSSGDNATTVPGTDIATLAANALSAKLGFTPQITCQDERVPLTVGFEEPCAFTADDGDHAVAVTITKFDGTDYSINAKVVS